MQIGMSRSYSKDGWDTDTTEMPFGWLTQQRPQGGPRRRWRDIVKSDLRKAGIEEDHLFELANSSRAAWDAAYQDIFEQE